MLSNSTDSMMPTVVRMATVDAAIESGQDDALDPIARTSRGCGRRPIEEAEHARPKPMPVISSGS